MRTFYRTGLVLLNTLLAVGCARRFETAPPSGGALFNTCTSTQAASRGIKLGTTVAEGEYPNVGGLYWAPADNNAALGPQDFVCSGSVVGEGYILSAGHCVYLDGKNVTSPAGLYFTLLNKNDPNLLSSMVAVEALMPHPDYSIQKNIGPDLAVLKLAQGIVGSCNFAPVNGYTLVPGEATIAVGLGLDIYNNFGTKMMAELLFSAYQNTQSPSGQQYPNGSLFLSNKVFGSSTCAGDSGSPLYTEDGELAGVLSSGAYLFGISSCLTSISSYYTAVPPFVSWIESALEAL